MNRIHDTPWVTPPIRRSVWRLLLTVVVTLGASAACTPERTDSDEPGGARLSTGDAASLLSNGFTVAGSGGSGLEALSQAPTGPPPGEMTVASFGVDFGTPEAPLRMMEFFDYGCGFCRGFHQDTRGPLHEQYVDPGLVFWKTVPFVIGRWPASLPVTLAAECARDQGRSYFEAISDLIFESQSEWKTASDPEEVAERYAQEAGLDMPRYRTCFESDEFLWRVKAHTDFANDMGIRGTPTFILDGWAPISGALPLETFQMIIDTTLIELAARQP
jgi:protein-disulfide isomerase